MWAMIPMFRVFSSVNLRGMKVLSSFRSFFAVCPDYGQKNGPFRAQVLHTEVGPEMWAMSLGSPCEGSFGPLGMPRQLPPAVHPPARYAPPPRGRCCYRAVPTSARSRVTVVPPGTTGPARYALGLIGLAMLSMPTAPWRGARPAAVRCSCSRRRLRDRPVVDGRCSTTPGCRPPYHSPRRGRPPASTSRPGRRAGARRLGGDVAAAARSRVTPREHARALPPEMPVEPARPPRPRQRPRRVRRSRGAPPRDAHRLRRRMVASTRRRAQSVSPRCVLTLGPSPLVGSTPAATAAVLQPRGGL